jgi:hypothetical protein
MRAEEVSVEQLLEQLRPTEDERVKDWRFDALVWAGYNPLAALSLAETRHVDLHQAASLLANGCPQETALRILL